MNEDIHIIDLGKDFFLIKFKFLENFHKALHGGPWFLGKYFLTVRRWEPNFRASVASLPSTAIWVRLPELPYEYYDLCLLKKVGNTIGTLLKIDTTTLEGKRRQFARLCVHVQFDAPLKRVVHIGQHMQPLIYEGVSAICFSCGKLGHKDFNCPYGLPPPLGPHS